MNHLNELALCLSACSMASTAAMAQANVDTTKVHQLQDGVVSGIRAAKNAPYAVANIQRAELKQFATTGKEMPFLFARTPGALAWSENGVGTGTTYMRLRGSAGSRINITLDGVSLNSPEDQTVFWANMNSYASLLGSVQIQRGVGASTNGDGAFGGSISLATAAPSLTPTAEVTGSYGSYNTFNTGASFSTGLLWNHLIFDGAYHHTGTDGFLHGTGGNSGSYYGGLTWLGDGFKISYKNIGNYEKTGQAWNGVISSDYDTNEPLTSYGIHSYKDMYEAGLGKYNNMYENLIYSPDDWSKGIFTTERYKMRDGSLWNKTTDLFYQNHNILSAAWTPADHWSHSVTLHYTYGYGYYREFKNNTKLSKFGFTPFTDSEGNTYERTDFVRKKGLTQNAYGAIYNVNYSQDNLRINGGVNLQQFKGQHWGYLTYMAVEEMEKTYFGKDGRYKYYDSDGDKNDYSAFIKGSYTFSTNWNAFLDLQYRHVDYKTDGINDKFIKQADGTYRNHVLDVDNHYDFFNPKAGLSYTIGGHKAYASIAMSNREPERNNYTDNGHYPAPKHEKVYDTEMGYQYTAANWHVGVNLYYMKYRNQLVQTGEKSDIGEPLTANVKDSYRTGAEITAGWSPLSWLSLEGNAALSKNKIKDFDEYADDWNSESGTRTIHYSNSTLAYSPSAILNGFIDCHYRGFSATWHTNFVSHQYVDNSASSESMLPCYSQTNVNLQYARTLKKSMGIKGFTLGVDFNNIFSRRYAPSGFSWYTWYSKDKRNTALSYIPMAGFTCMGHVTLRF